MSGWRAVLGLCAVLAGCGGPSAAVTIPHLAPVTGTVTLNGKPLADALVVFEPKKISGDQRESRAITGSDGRYVLTYYDNHQGAVPGAMTVRIFKIEHEQQQVPDMYNVSSTLTAEVKDGPNTFDFSLSSQSQ